MPRSIRIAGLSVVAWLVAITVTWAQAPVDYRLSFADYVRHVVDVEAVFSDITADTLEIHMSRSSPGRYALHEFAKNVFDLQISDGAGRALTPARPNLHVWSVKDHGGTVRVRYRLFADRIDGTYAGVDATQAHLNLPATLVWAKSFETRPARLTFVPPPDVTWTVASQLYATDDPLVFTAPNLAYLLDSPVQFGPQTMRTFQVAVNAAAAAPQATIRVALRHDGTEAEVDRFAAGVEKIVREARAVFGELPAFEPGHYTFLATYAQGASGDGMEHRNSTVLTAPAAIAQAERPLLNTVAHEFFHAWNVERIRPRSLEPFNFDDANVSSELWVAEGFTQYYGALLMARAGLSTRDDALRSMGGLINAVNASAGRRVRFAPEMSRLAPFVDAACSVDPTNWGNTYLSYYTFGAAIALGLDLELRDRTDGRIGLDDYMKALWTKYGKTPSPPGTVATPYTPADLQTTLAEVSGSVSFAREFFERYVDGPELVEYGMLLKRMGLIWKPLHPGRGWMGDLPMTTGTDGARITNAAPMGTPAYDAGFGEGDVLVSIGGQDVRSASDVAAIVEAAKPGDRLDARYLRHGKPRAATIALRGHPARTLVTRESAGETPTPEELKMRDAWLGSRAKK
jgi:predicted metalloprotease with PDZ domain